MAADINTVQAMATALSDARRLLAHTGCPTDWMDEAQSQGRALIEQMQREAVQPDLTCDCGAVWRLTPYGWGQRADTMDAAPQPAQASDRVEQIQPVHPVAGVGTGSYGAWRPIETAPQGTREMFVVRGFGVRGGTYTTDAYCVWSGFGREFVRWPHEFPPTHWMPLPPAPTGADNGSPGSDEQGSPSPSLRGEPRMLSDEEIDDVQEAAYRALVAQGYNGGMGGLTWDRASARAIERAILSRAGIGESRREPIPDDEIEGAYRTIYRNLPSGFGHAAFDWIEQGIRYAERHHGITPQAGKESGE